VALSTKTNQKERKKERKKSFLLVDNARSLVDPEGTKPTHLPKGEADIY